MMMRFGLVMVMAMAIMLAGCSTPPNDGDAVAIWDNGRLERQAFASWLALHELQPSADAIRRLALSRALAEAARGRGADEEPEVLLAIESARHRILIRALETHIDEQIEISEEEIAQWQQAHPDAFERPRRLFLRGIFKRLPDDPEQRQALRQRMEALRAQVIDGAELGPLAADESQSQNRFREGAVGFVDPGDLPPAVRDAVENLDVGEVSNLVEHAGGLAFYACERVKPAKSPDSEEVRFRLRQNLFRQHRAGRMDTLTEKLGERIAITPHQDPVLTVGDYSLPAAWLDALAREQIGDERAEHLDERNTNRLLQDWGMRVALADHAENIGLANRLPWATALEWRRTRALATDELRHRVDAQLQPPEESELLALFEQRSSRLRHPAAVRVAAIKFANAGDLDRHDTLQRARAIQARIRAGELEFDQAARQHSILPSAANGGRLGWLTPQQLGSLDPHLLRPVRQLSPGEDTGLLHLQGGLWSLKLLERRDPRPMTFDEARDQLARVFREEQIKRLEVIVRERELAGMNLRILDEKIAEGDR